MENKELLHFILGYLYEINNLEKIPSKKLKRVKKFIIEFEKKPIYKDDFSDTDYDKSENYDNLMDNYDYNNDYDQQDPNFW